MRTTLVTRLTLGALAVSMLVLAAACTTARMDKPEGFAKSESREFLAVSPEGIRLTVRKIANYPVKDVVFWRDTLKNQLAKQGYFLFKEGDFQAMGAKGLYIEWAVPFERENYAYLTALFTTGEWIVLAEAGGPLSY